MESQNSTVEIQEQINQDTQLLLEEEAINLLDRFHELKLKNEIIVSELKLSLSDNDEDLCRICRYKQTNTNLIESPCKCKGTLGFIHSRCLSQWQRIRKSDTCEICQNKYKLILSKRTFKILFLRFFKWKYGGKFTKSIIDLLLITWLVETNGFQLNELMESLERPSYDLPVSKLLLLPLFYTGVLGIVLYKYSAFVENVVYDLMEVLTNWWWGSD